MKLNMKLRYLLSALIISLIATPLQLASAQSATRITSTEAVKPIIVEDRDFNPRGFYTIRQDFRKCVSPLCGGFFVKRVNRRLTRCADGSLQPECYVATVNWRGIGFDLLAYRASVSSGDPLPLLLRGRIRTQEFKGFGNKGKFVVKSAYRALGHHNASSLYAGLQDNGIVCVTSPCFSTDQYKLNSKRTRAVSGIDLSNTKASDDELKRAAIILVDGGVLLAAGTNVQTDEQGRAGLDFVANQIFLPLGR